MALVLQHNLVLCQPQASVVSPEGLNRRRRVVYVQPTAEGPLAVADRCQLSADLASAQYTTPAW